MGRGLFTAGLLVAGIGVANAGPSRKVKIETEPAGATVYFNSKEEGPVCTTPCSVEAPIGETPIIVELEDHKQIVQMLEVLKRGKASVTYTLEPAIGTIVVDGPKGASILIDKVAQGTAPTSVEISAGPHVVELVLDGKTIDTQAVELEAGGEITVTGSRKQVADGDSEDDDNLVITDDTTTVTPKRPRQARGPIVKVSAAFDVGFRDFVYSEPETPNLREESERGQVLVGPHVEIWPGTIAGVSALRGLSLLIRYGHGVNSQQVREANGTPTSATTFWRAFEASARHRWTFGQAATLEVGAGFVRDQYQFEGDVNDIMLVPDADYQSIRIGVRGSMLVGSVEPYVSAENRIVISGGKLEERFEDGAEASGLRLALGVGATFGSVTGRLEGAYTRYSWTFKNDSTMDPFIAAGGVDAIKQVSFVLGYAY